MSNQTIIALANQKGGVGKTTCTRELSCYLSSKGCRVLIIDCDPQGNLTNGLSEDNTKGLFDALSGYEYELKHIKSNLSLLTADSRLSTLEKSLVAEMDAYLKLKNLLENEIFQEFEYIFIDCPPSLGILTVNVLVCATNVVVPINPTLYSLQGTNDLFNTLAKVKKNFNPDIKIAGILLNEVDCRPIISNEIREEVREHFGDMVFNMELPKSIKFEEAIAQMIGVVDLKGARVNNIIEEIMATGEELLDRLGVDYGEKKNT